MIVRGFFLGALILVATLPACSSGESGMRDGYYTAESASFDGEGWKDFLTIYVSQNKIVTVEYNARNASGFIKSWDIEYMRRMKATSGTYPNEYTRLYSADLLNKQDPGLVRSLPGAERQHGVFQLLAKSAMDHAKRGDPRIAFVELPLALNAPDSL